MKKIKITEKLNNQIKELRNSRNNIEYFNFNFLSNISRYAISIHDLIRVEPDPPEVAISQYIISLVSCWETFFRDTFVFVVSKDASFKEEIISLIKLNKEEINQAERENLIADFLSKSFNFQNFIDIENAFSPIFIKQMFTTIGNHTFPYLGLNGRVAANFCYEELLPNHIESIKQAYEERHKITHDANYRINIKKDFIQKAEASFVIFPQLFTIWLSEKMHLPVFMLNIDQVVVPYIFTIKEILATDWEVVPETY